jgi:hypothetical protein
MPVKGPAADVLARVRVPVPMNLLPFGKDPYRSIPRLVVTPHRGKKRGADLGFSRRFVAVLPSPRHFGALVRGGGIATPISFLLLFVQKYF